MVKKFVYLVGFVLLGACTLQPQIEEPKASGIPEEASIPEAKETPAIIEEATISEGTDTNDGTVQEFPVTAVALAGAVSSRNAEISGLAWYGETLILMPQYPKFDGDANVFALSKSDIEAYLAATNPEPLIPQEIPMNDSGLATMIDGFEGYEAVAFIEDRIYLTVEANGSEGMRGYLVAGRIAPDLSELVMETAVITEILPQTNQNNHSDETLLVDSDTLITIYETNGIDVNEAPVAHRFDADLSELDTLPIPHIEYRVTDATTIDENGRFWVINYFYPGDTGLQTERDVLATRQGGWGATHLVYDQVERLVELQLTDENIEFTDAPPILLELPNEEARNWEGIVRFNDGFLLATDKFPDTILAYVER